MSQSEIQMLKGYWMLLKNYFYLLFIIWRGGDVGHPYSVKIWSSGQIRSLISSVWPMKLRIVWIMVETFEIRIFGVAGKLYEIAISVP